MSDWAEKSQSAYILTRVQIIEKSKIQRKIITQAMAVTRQTHWNFVALAWISLAWTKNRTTTTTTKKTPRDVINFFPNARQHVHEFIFQFLLALSLLDVMHLVCVFSPHLLLPSSSSPFSLRFSCVCLCVGILIQSASRKRMFMRSRISIIWALAFSHSRIVFSFASHF